MGPIQYSIDNFSTWIVEHDNILFRDRRLNDMIVEHISFQREHLYSIVFPYTLVSIDDIFHKFYSRRLLSHTLISIDNTFDTFYS